MDADALVQTIRRAFLPIEQIRLAYLFGSRAVGAEGPGSDVDIAIVSRPPLKLDDRIRMASELGGLLGAPVDLVPLDRAPIELAWNVIATGRVLLSRSLAERVEYEANVQSRYGDHLPVLRAQRAETLSGEGHDAGARRYREEIAALVGVRGEAGGTG